MYDVDRMPARISIGRETESGVTEVRFSCASWLKKWPGMKVTALHRPYGHDPYILRTEMVGSELVWTVSDADTAVPGTGKLEIYGEVDGKRKVSAMADVLVAGRMGGVAGPVPDPERPWVERAEGAADRAEDALQEIRDKIASGEFKGEPGAPGKDAVVDDTLTQHGQAADAKVTGEALSSKLTEPSTGLEVGKYFRIAAIDEAGHAVLEAVDAPVGGVQDVLVDGASIVADGVANVSKYVVVKDAMCDGKGAAWTADEQKAARERIGVHGEFELIEEITLSENVMNVAREAFPDGTHYNLRSLIIVVDSGNVENRVAIDGWVRLNAKLSPSEWAYIAPGKLVGVDDLISFFVYRVSSDGSVDSYFTSTINATSTACTSYRTVVPINVVRFGMHITDFLIYSTGEAIPANTKIAIYGVRA